MMMTQPQQKLQEVDDTIKFALPQDIVQIVAFGYKSFDENLLAGYGISPSYKKTVLKVTNWVMNHAVLVKRNEKDDKFIDGVCAMETTSTWWSTDPCLFVSLFFIKEDKRSFKLARNLLKAAQEYAIMYDIPLAMDLIGQKDTERKKKLLKYLGFKELGSLFIFTPKVIQDKEL